MSLCSKMAAKQYCKLPVFVVEEHHDALPHIYRAIGGRYLPFSGVAMLHLDSHPDLLVPDLRAEHYHSTERLYETLDIANWLAPALYCSHVTTLVWMKPPWANQMQECGPVDLGVGCDKESKHVKFDLMLPYFLNEGLCTPVQEMESVKRCSLWVKTLRHSSSPSDSSENSGVGLSPGHKVTGFTEMKEVFEGESFCSLSPAKRVKMESLDSAERSVYRRMSFVDVLRQHEAWILDIDLDFFATGNPFKKNFTEAQYRFLTALYSWQRCPADGTEECLKWQRKRQQFLCDVKQFWEGKMPCDVLTDRCSQVKEIVETNRSTLDEIFRLLHCTEQVEEDQDIVDAELVHTAGFVSDLPVHASSLDEVRSMCRELKHVLHSLHKPPTLVTIARSSTDGYTPCHLVDCIQKEVLTALEDLYRDLDIKCLYQLQE